jgi:hypothetical protein
MFISGGYVVLISFFFVFGFHHQFNLVGVSYGIKWFLPLPIAGAGDRTAVLPTKIQRHSPLNQLTIDSISGL